MRNIFVTVSSTQVLNSNEAKSEAKLNNQFDQIMEEFIQIVKEDFSAVGLTLSSKGETLRFDPNNFSHSDIISAIQDYEYNYADFDGVSFPTKKYSCNGKDSEYYLEKRFDDYDFTVAINVTIGRIEISDARYIDSVSVSNSGSGTEGKPKSKAKQIEKKIEDVTETLRALKSNSKYKQVEEYSRRNGIIRADIKLSKLLVARLFVDVRGRIDDYLMIGYFLGRKYFAINHTPINFTGKAKEDGVALAKVLYGFHQAYQHRVAKGFYEKEKKDRETKKTSR